MTEIESFSIYSSADEENEESSNAYEPDAKLIAKLYCEIKESKVLSLDWKFSGMIQFWLSSLIEIIDDRVISSDL